MKFTQLIVVGVGVGLVLALTPGVAWAADYVAPKPYQAPKSLGVGQLNTDAPTGMGLSGYNRLNTTGSIAEGDVNACYAAQNKCYQSRCSIVDENKKPECIELCNEDFRACDEAYRASVEAKEAGRSAKGMQSSAETHFKTDKETRFTETFATGAQVMNMAGTMSTNAATTVMGAQAANKAMTNNSQSEQLKSAASMTRITGASQLGLGTIGAAAGGYLISRGLKHDSHSERIAALKRNAENEKETAADARQKADLAARAGKFREADAYALSAGKAERAAAAAVNELNALQAKEASAAAKAQAMGATSLMKGMGDMISGTAAILAAREMDKAAKNMQASQGIIAPGMSMSSDPLAPKDGVVISGSGEGPEIAGVTADDAAKTGDDDLGTPLGNLAPDGLSPAPPAGEFVSKEISPGSGGGGGGGTSTSPSGGSGADGDSAPKMAAASQGSYESSGGGTSSSSGGGRGGVADKGIDLASMLGQLLPKPEQEEQRTDILAFGNREPASDNSILGPDSKSLFQRVAETTQAKYKNGMLR